MERFFLFDNINTFYDWNLILTAKDITPPEPKYKFINLDGMSGSLDLTEALTGKVEYNDRTIKASFWTDVGTRADREALLQEITRTLHGRKIKIIEPDDPEHYYLGRLKITSKKNILPYAEFSIEATCEPWRYAVEYTVRTITSDVLYGSVDEWPTTTISYNGIKPVKATVKFTGFSGKIMWGKAPKPGVSASVSQYDFGSRTVDIDLYPGKNIITLFSSNSVNGAVQEVSVTITYREVDL